MSNTMTLPNLGTKKMMLIFMFCLTAFLLFFFHHQGSFKADTGLPNTLTDMTVQDDQNVCVTFKNSVAFKYNCLFSDRTWWDAGYPVWEKSTFEFLDQATNFDLFLSIGEWEGPVAIYAGLKYKVPLIIYEPDPIAIIALLNNLKMNKVDFQLHMNCLWNETKSMLFTGGGRSDSAYFAVGDGKPAVSWVAHCLTLPQIISSALSSGHFKSFFLKLDVEGTETWIIEDLLRMPVLPNYMSFSLHHFWWWYVKEEVFLRKVVQFSRRFKYYYFQQSKHNTADITVEWLSSFKSTGTEVFLIRD